MLDFEVTHDDLFGNVGVEGIAPLFVRELTFCGGRFSLSSDLMYEEPFALDAARAFGSAHTFSERRPRAAISRNFRSNLNWSLV